MENVNTRMTKYDTTIKQAIQHLQERTRFEDPTAVLHGV